jgi:hypothetical protein
MALTGSMLALSGFFTTPIRHLPARTLGLKHAPDFVISTYPFGVGMAMMALSNARRFSCPGLRRLAHYLSTSTHAITCSLTFSDRSTICIEAILSGESGHGALLRGWRYIVNFTVENSYTSFLISTI